MNVQNAGKVGYGMYDDKLLDRIATLERKLGMPARTASWKPLMSKGAAVQHNGALSIPFGCNIFMKRQQQDEDVKLICDVDALPENSNCNALQGISHAKIHGI